MANTSSVIKEVVSPIIEDVDRGKTLMDFKITSIGTLPTATVTYYGFYAFTSPDIGTVSTDSLTFGDGSSRTLEGIYWGDDNSVSLDISGSVSETATDSEVFRYVQIGSTRFYRADANPAHDSLVRYHWSPSPNPIGTSGESKQIIIK